MPSRSSWTHHVPVVLTLVVLLTPTIVLVAAAYSPLHPPLPGSSSSYLDTLGQQYRQAGNGLSSPIDDVATSSKTVGATNDNNHNNNGGVPDEEYYGLTNPMATNWAGSKHETYGGYLHRLTPSSKAQSTAEPELIERPTTGGEWYGNDRPMASWEGYRHPRYGGYLETLHLLQPPALQQNHNNDVKDDGNTR
jgi:hypothetical protein